MNKRNRKILKTILSLITSIFVGVQILLLSSSCSPISKEEIVNALFPNVWVFLSHCIATVLLISMFIWLLWKPTKTFLQQKHDFINSEIEAAKNKNKQANSILDDANKIKQEAIENASLINTDAVINANKIIEQAKKSANIESAQIIKNANEEIKHQQQIIENNAKHNAVDTALLIVENVLKKKLSDKDKKTYIDDLLSEIDKVDKKDA